MAVTHAAFILKFPEFDLTNMAAPGPDTAQDARIDASLAAAEDHHDRTLFRTTAAADEAIMYYTAHLLARSPFAVNARIQKSRGDENLVTGEDIYRETWARLCAAPSFMGGRVP